MAESIPSSSITKFAMPTPPVGWTQITLYNNYSLRVTSGTTSTGGTSPYTSAFSSKTASGVNNISLATIATSAGSQTHTHTGGAGAVSGVRNLVTSGTPSSGTTPMWIWPGTFGTFQTGANGSSEAHSHTIPVPAAVNSPVTGATIDFSLRYIDVILAQRN